MKPASTLAEIDNLNQESILQGYRDGFKGRIDTTRLRDNAYMHGICVGQADKRGNPTPNQRRLAAEFLRQRP